MKLLIAITLLVAIQTVPPVSQQAADNNADKASTKNEGSDNKQQNAAPSITSSTSTSQGSARPSTAPKGDSAPETHPKSGKTYQPWNTADYLSAIYDCLTFGLIIVGICGVRLALRTLKAIQRQAAIMEKQLTVPYRAYLGIIEPEQPIDERGVGSPRTWSMFPVVNNGHVRARIVSVDVEVIIQIQGKEVYRSSAKEIISTHGEIPPEKVSSYAVNVYWPPSFPNADAIVVSVDIEYDTGFKETGNDTMNFVRVFKPKTQKWTTGYGGIHVDVAKNGDKQNSN